MHTEIGKWLETHTYEVKACGCELVIEPRAIEYRTWIIGGNREVEYYSDKLSRESNSLHACQMALTLQHEISCPVKRTRRHAGYPLPEGHIKHTTSTHAASRNACSSMDNDCG